MEQGESPYERVTVMPGKPDKSDTSDCVTVPAHTGKLSFLEKSDPHGRQSCGFFCWEPELRFRDLYPLKIEKK